MLPLEFDALFIPPWGGETWPWLHGSMPDSPKLHDPRRASIGEGSGPKKIGMGQRKAAQG